MRAKPSACKERRIASPRSSSTKRSKYLKVSELSILPFELYLICNAFRRLMVLDDQYRTACEELAEKKESLKKNRPTPAAMRADQSEIKRLENQLDKALNSYNDLQSGNK